MQKRLSASYRSAAQQHKTLLAPVGEVFAQIKRDQARLFPRLYKGDGSHPELGGYAVAYCLHAVICEEATPGVNTRNSNRNSAIDEPTREAIRHAVDKVMAGFNQTPPSKVESPR